jgi:hypothetical protein
VVTDDLRVLPLSLASLFRLLVRPKFRCWILWRKKWRWPSPRYLVLRGLLVQLHNSPLSLLCAIHLAFVQLVPGTGHGATKGCPVESQHTQLRASAS